MPEVEGEQGIQLGRDTVLGGHRDYIRDADVPGELETPLLLTPVSIHCVRWKKGTVRICKGESCRKANLDCKC
jgi:hypothetical protein